MTVRSEIESKLLGWANAQVPPVAVSIQNVAFVKPITAYLELFVLDGVTINPDVAAATERETGIFQINICVPQNTGNKVADALEASMRALFSVLPKVGTVSIERPAKKSKPFNTDVGFQVTPLSFSYRQER